MSVGVQQFSLNGTHRNQGYVGQTSLSRSLPRTLAKGNTLKGYGGTNGNFVIKPSVISAVTSTEDPSIVKTSVLSNNGMISTHYRWIRRPQPYTSVKPDNSHNTNTQHDYINYIQNKTIYNYNTCQDNTKSCTNVYNSRLPTIIRNSSIFNFTKPENSYKPMSQSDHVLNLVKKCVKTDYKYVHSTQRTPLPFTS